MTGALALWILLLCASAPSVHAHIVPAEKFHPVAESYRRMNFILNLNPVTWDLVREDAEMMMEYYGAHNAEEAREYREKMDQLIEETERDGAGPAERKHAARGIFEICTTAAAEMIIANIDAANASLGDHAKATGAMKTARQIWACFEHEVKFSDREGFGELGAGWLELSSALGFPGVLNIGAIEPDAERFHAEARKIIHYIETNYGEGYEAPSHGRLAPLPMHSTTFDPEASIPPMLPPGHNINKQLPRPRQVLNMVERGVDESETALIALGDLVFDSPYIFGEPARSLQFSCNTCHNKGTVNSKFMIPGLSARDGGMDVTNSYFAPHANDGHIGHLDIPDLRGIRFTAPYGRNGRIGSLREFVRNVIVNEFNGAEPDPTLLDGMIAYMNEFDFLPNDLLDPDGTLNADASDAASRGEKIFNQTFESMGNRSCATCHIPSANFLDHQRHDIGSVMGATAYSLDRAMDTPTLLSAKYSAPYFHDGSQPTLRSVNEWFNDNFDLGLDEGEIDDLTAYVEAVGDGVDAIEDSILTLEAEMEEFSFFLSAYEYLKQIGNSELINTTFQTIAQEIHAHKWDIQDDSYLSVLNRMAELMEEAYSANLQSDRTLVDARVAEYRRMYAENADYLK